jgi:hypothetical protein
MTFGSSKRWVEEPVTQVVEGIGRRDETQTTHPAYAQIGVSRVSGQMNLFDSDFVHNAYMVIRIHPTTLRRNLSNDWFFADRVPFIEVALSEAQWASFVSSPNVGDGVPCTMVYKDGKPIAELPSPVDRSKQFRGEMTKDIADTLAAVDELDELLDTMGLPKGKTDTLRSKARTIRAKLTDSIPFVAEQFDEHMEKGVEKGKAELHGYMTGVLQRAGLEALTGGVMPLQIDRPADTTLPSIEERGRGTWHPGDET